MEVEELIILSGTIPLGSLGGVAIGFGIAGESESGEQDAKNTNKVAKQNNFFIYIEFVSDEKKNPFKK